MKEIIYNHLRLQRTRFERASTEFGLHPTVSYILACLLFAGMSYMLLSRSTIEKWEYITTAILVFYLLASTDRLRFYKQIYSAKTFTRIRLIENAIVLAPFVPFLIYFGAYHQLIALISIAGLMSILNGTKLGSFTLSTPFYRFPFEFTAGFRLSWIVILGLYILAFIAITVDNSLLGIFALLILTLSSIMYYQYPEPEYYIWIHNMDSRSFLIHKIKIALGYTTLVCLPLLVVIIFVWPTLTLWVILGMVCALLFLSTCIVAKYSMYPNIFNLPIALALSLGFVAPPILLILFPYLFKRAAQTLKSTLS